MNRWAYTLKEKSWLFDIINRVKYQCSFLLFIWTHRKQTKIIHKTFKQIDLFWRTGNIRHIGRRQTPFEVWIAQCIPIRIVWKAYCVKTPITNSIMDFPTIFFAMFRLIPLCVKYSMRFEWHKLVEPTTSIRDWLGESDSSIHFHLSYWVPLAGLQYW